MIIMTEMNLTADEVRKTYKLMDTFKSPLGGNYSLWINENRVVGIHDDDDEIVSIFDLKLNQYVYFDKKTKKGMEILDSMRK